MRLVTINVLVPDDISLEQAAQDGVDSITALVLGDNGDFNVVVTTNGEQQIVPFVPCVYGVVPYKDEDDVDEGSE